MPLLTSFYRCTLGILAFGLCWTLPGQAHAQIGKVDGRNVESAPCWSFLPKFDFHSICLHGLCPSCKRRYCPLDAMPNYGYSAPRWHAFPGTNPNYSPKKKDVGISVPGALPTTEPTKNGASLRPPTFQRATMEPPLAPSEQVAKPVIIPVIKPTDGDQ